MKPIYCLAFLCWCLSASAQKIVIEKGKDTLFVSDKDTLAKIPFKLTSAVISSDAQVSIRVHSSDAVEGTEFELRDAYGAAARLINITRLDNASGEFKVNVAGGVKDYKTVNLETMIVNKGQRTLAIVPLVLAPARKATKEDKKEEKKEDKGLTLKFSLYNDINIPVYNSSDSASKTVVKHRVLLVFTAEKKVAVSVNIERIEVKQVDSSKYRITVFTTDNEEYKATLKLNTDYEFQTDDKLYLNGQNGADYIHAKDILEISKENAGEKTQTITPDKPDAQFKTKKS